LAKRFNGEIVNGDAMQMYKGLPIITNKVSDAERQNIPHHIFDQIGLDEQPWKVCNFRKEAHKTIREIRSRGKLPILVGGTHYYAKAVLFNGYLLNHESGSSERVEEELKPKFSILDRSTSEILARLCEVDPKIAQRWHPADRRKIQRSLEIWLQTGKTASQIYEEQSRQRLDLRAKEMTVEDNPSIAYSSLIFWLRAEDDVLKARLDDRVDSMLASGLIEEVHAIAKHEGDLKAAGVQIDKTRGIWASIGYKEVEPYLSALGGDMKTQMELDKLKASCIEAIKAATRRYARRQERWIRTHFSVALTEAGVMDTLYPLDCTHLDEWDVNVQMPVIGITGRFLAGNDRPPPETLSDMAREIIAHIKEELEKDDMRGCRYCEVCDKTMMTEKEWVKHLKSNTHRNAASGRKRWEAFQAWKARQAEQRD
jgi:tRNA dimethylallyltransferase